MIEGTFTGVATNEFQTAELLLRRALYRSCGYRLDFVCGYRYAKLQDSLLLTDDANPVKGDGNNIDAVDSFDTTNKFNGGEIGFVIEVIARWSLETTTKLAVGDMQSLIDIDGTTINTPRSGAPIAYAGGVLAIP